MDRCCSFERSSVTIDSPEGTFDARDSDVSPVLEKQTTLSHYISGLSVVHLRDRREYRGRPLITGLVVRSPAPS